MFYSLLIMRTQDACLAGLVLFLRQHSQLAKSIVLAHLVAQELTLVLRTQCSGRIDVLDQLDEELLAFTRAADSAGNADERRVPVHALELQRLSRATQEQEERPDTRRQGCQRRNEIRGVAKDSAHAGAPRRWLRRKASASRW